MKQTNIEWCDSTVNPTAGCDGCELWTPRSAEQQKRGALGGACYAGQIHTRFQGTNPGYPRPFEEAEPKPGRMAEAAKWPDLRGRYGAELRPDKPWLGGLPRMIFIGDMADNLSRAIAFEYLHREIILNVTSPAGSRHFYLWLTKQPGRMLAFDQWLIEQGVPWPDNLMAMTSITTQATVARAGYLLQMRAPWKGLSVEPLRGPVDLRSFLEEPCPEDPGGQHFMGCGCDDTEALNWIIVGGESGRGATPCNVGWIRSVVRQADEVGVPVFVKQIGSRPYDPAKENSGDRAWPTGPAGVVNEHGFWPQLRDSKGGDWHEWPEDLRRREMPRLSEREGVGS